MVQESVFRGVMGFLGEVGVYDIILPFLIVFTIVFAILDKTKIFGVDKIGENSYPKKNLNAIIAFSAAFLVIASTKLVGVINTVLSHVVLLLLLAVCFLMLVGVFFTDKEFSLEDNKNWVIFFMFFMFLGISIIFLNALGWLEEIFNLFRNWRAEWAATIIFLIIIFVFIAYIVGGDAIHKKSTKEEKKE